MPLSKPGPRSHIHSRDILCKGYRRDDGLWDIEAVLTDSKTYSFENADRDGVAAGEPVHLIQVRVTIDEDMTVKAIDAAVDAGPFDACARVPDGVGGLVGLTLGPGWRKAVAERLADEAGCTHLRELLLGPIATTAHQAVRAARRRRHGEGGGKPPLIDSCHALKSGGAAVKRNWPEHYTGKD